MGYQIFLRASTRIPSLIGRNQYYSRTLATRVHENETFLTGSSSLYAEQMYENYMADRNSVHETWRKYFDDLDEGKNYEEKYFNRPTVVVSSVKQSASTSAVAAMDANKTHLAVCNPILDLDFVTLFLDTLFFKNINLYGYFQ